jgi:hypothetical protein
LNDFQATLALVQFTFQELDEAVPNTVKIEIGKLLTRARDCLEAFNTFMKEKVLRETKDETYGASPKLRKRAKFKEVVGQAQCQVDAIQRELLSIKLSLALALGVATM